MVDASPRVLGLHYNSLHDSSVAVVGPDGRVEFALSEERVSRVKKDGRFPYGALRHVELDRIDVVAVPYLKHPEGGFPASPAFRDELMSIDNSVTPFPPQWRQTMGQLGKPVWHYDHHLSHASAGYHLSGFSEAIVFTSDAGARNCSWSTCFFHATPDGIALLAGASIEHYWPLCKVYSDVTALLGFRPLHHEGKVTGLAGSGRPSAECRDALWEWFTRVSAREVSGVRPILYDWNDTFGDEAPDLRVDAEYSRTMRAELSAFTDLELARAAQDILEAKSIRLLSGVLADAPKVPLVLSGGMFANVTLNMRLQEHSGRHVFVCPPMGDEGLSVGAALLAHRELASVAPAIVPLRDLYWGPLPSEQPEEELAALGLVVHRLDDPSATVGRLLAEGAIVAVVRGRAEFGPRALGNRSVLCRADDRCYTDALNYKLLRDEFMPFAPCISSANADSLLDPNQVVSAGNTARFMTISLRASPALAAACPAVVHVDGTVRAQLVDESGAPFLAAVLAQYEKHSGLPALINTSFNIHGEPIVGDLGDAVRAFAMARLDYLLVEDCLIAYAENAARLDAALEMPANRETEIETVAL